MKRRCSYDSVSDEIVCNENASTTGTSEDVGEASLEEGFTSFLLEDLLTILSGTNISGDSGSSEIEYIDDEEGSGTSSSTEGHVTKEEHFWFSLWVIWVEDLLVEVLTGEFEC